MSKARRRGLGRGLDALLPGGEPEDGERVAVIEIDRIRPNPFQPRQDFDEEGLAELAASIREHGLVQPVILRNEGDLTGRYQLVAGERRWRAARMAGLNSIPAVIRELDDLQMMEIALIENLQREDLNPIEEATAYRTLMESFNLTQEDVSRKVGKSRSFIANAVRLLNLAPEVQKMVSAGDLSAAHGRALLAFSDRSTQVNMARRAVERRLTVQDVEKLAKKLGSSRPGKKPAKGRDAEMFSVEERLRTILGTPVTIKPRARKGFIVIEYFGAEDLNRILAIFESCSGQS